MAGTTTAGAASRVRVSLYGAVQGVGFRPFVFRLATECALRGWVLNSGSGLVVEGEGPRAALDEFLRRLEAERPPASLVLTTETVWLPEAGYQTFEIRSSDASEATTSILPDLAICPECLAEIADPRERRYLYPFTNCTRCGPRHSIVTGIPYDRANTTMADFHLCSDCRCDYSDPGDRRFHAQPIACPVCGPKLDLEVGEAAKRLHAGQVLAIKGIGGFQLLCDARDAAAVARLRDRKQRDAKPFAMMMPDIATVRRYCIVSEAEEKLLCSAAAPVVLLRPKGTPAIATNVSEASPFYGVMLPYSPLHRLLLDAFPHPVVATSGNLSGEPIAIANAEAHSRLGGIADSFLTHNRRIARPVDDSVARVSRGRECVLRRARGYAPLPVRAPSALPRVLAVGAHLKNTVAIALGRDVYLSPHVGDLDTLEARRAFENAIDDLCRMYRFEPELIACDLHPDYASTRWAEASGKPLVRVQHHHAHAAACAAENDLREPYLAVSWDGTGYGLDGTIWGGEFFAVEGRTFHRVASLRPFRLAGGEAAIREGWRCAAALRWEAGQHVANANIRRMLERGLNAPLTSSVGRLFDAVASILGIAQVSAFEGQAAMLLERAAHGVAVAEPYPLGRDGDWRPLLECLQTEADPAVAAARFHLTLAHWIVDVARGSGLRDVVLSGGVFQNALLTEAACELLESADLRPFTHQRIPPNDGGIALGQAVLAGRA